MSRLVFMLEEQSMRVLLEGLLPRVFPELNFICVAHEGRSDLEKSLPRKLRSWQIPEDKFVVVRDADSSNCKDLKEALRAVCRENRRPDTLVRIVCQELEAWYFGQPESLAAAFANKSTKSLGKARYRYPDALVQPSKQLAELYPSFQKIGTARTMAAYLSHADNTSPSFRIFIEGVARVSGLPIPGGPVAL